jgi:hypothetical protein
MRPATRIQNAAVSKQLPGVAITFQDKAQQSRFDVVVSSPVGQELSGDLTSALRAIGFSQSNENQPELDGAVSLSFGREGYGLCGGWTAAERERLTSETRRTLRRFGFTMVPEIAA